MKALNIFTFSTPVRDKYSVKRSNFNIGNVFASHKMQTILKYLLQENVKVTVLPSTILNLSNTICNQQPTAMSDPYTYTNLIQPDT
jgi:hypothetical protein